MVLMRCRSYAATHADFPHESTANQWFSESQFESYRALGFHITESVLSEALARLGYPAAPRIDQILESLAATTAEAERRRRRRRRPPEPSAREEVSAREIE
jgi:hypothetical protein